MSTIGGANIVREGLVLYLDAANQKSYLSGSTVWKDLSLNNNSGSLVNGPTFDSANLGSIVFDGVDDYIVTPYNVTLLDFTVGAWFKSNGLNNTYNRIVDKDYASGFWIGRNFNIINSWGGGVLEQNYPYGRYITLEDNQWHYLVSIRSGSTHILYGDGITNTISGTVSTSALSGVQVRIGTQAGLGAYLNGSISSVQIYNRALSAQEILQNYEALKSRYGL